MASPPLSKLAKAWKYFLKLGNINPILYQVLPGRVFFKIYGQSNGVMYTENQIFVFEVLNQLGLLSIKKGFSA
jgi:hypothetical protein